jgi:hypothetical protein
VPWRLDLAAKEAFILQAFPTRLAARLDTPIQPCLPTSHLTCKLPLSVILSVLLYRCLYYAGLFERHIHALRELRFIEAIRALRDIISLPNVIGTIDGKHIPLIQRPSTHLTIIRNDFFNRKNFYSVLVHAVCNLEKYF